MESSIRQKLQTELRDALRARDQVKLDTLRGVLSDLQYTEMQKGVEELPNEEAIQVIQLARKRRLEEIEYNNRAKRFEAIEKLNQEIAIIDSFLPTSLSREEIANEIRGIFATNPAAPLGDIMKQLKENFPGRVDGKMASEVFREMSVKG